MRERLAIPSRHPRQFFISLYGWTYWGPILAAGVIGVVACLVIPGAWPGAIVFGVVTLACLAFYRDFERPIPREAGVMVAPADGKVTEIARVEHYAPFNGPALKVSIFLSVLDVHVNRSPCDGMVLWTRYEEGLFLDARHPECTNKNQSHTMCLADETGKPAVVVKQIVGAIARRIIAPVTVGERLARGQRFGMIAFGSRTELYVPEGGVGGGWTAAVPLNTHVKGGRDVLLRRGEVPGNQG
ncbi:MAG TPA: phosphatidylserine decarboxylase [Phycisphaerae bacterium]|nr:phosphatidylserine decarboxylase [Phycisphaerae bacterium]